jgi:hypothetical protein
MPRRFVRSSQRGPDDCNRVFWLNLGGGGGDDGGGVNVDGGKQAIQVLDAHAMLDDRLLHSLIQLDQLTL